jgi:hypothetical protein
MSRLPLLLLTISCLSAPVFAQEEPITDECAPTTLFQAFGLEDLEGCEPEVSPGDEVAGEEDTVSANPVAAAAKLPGNNREAALEHANDKSNGAVGAAHERRNDSEGRGDSGGENAGGKGGGRP